MAELILFLQSFASFDQLCDLHTNVVYVELKPLKKLVFAQIGNELANLLLFQWTTK